MRHPLFLGAVALAMAASAHAAPQTYRIDPVHSAVVFNVDHNGFSRSFGRLRITDGEIRFDRDNWPDSSVKATIDLASVDMGDADWDKAVRGSSLFDTDRERNARFVSDSVEKKNEDEGVLHGKLTLRGTTVPLDIPFRVNRVGTTIFGMHTVAGFSAYIELDRTMFGMTKNTGSIGTKVSVWLEIEATGGGKGPASHDKETPDAPAQ
jgi:polyisoprenoid-binding protein YceI